MNYLKNPDNLLCDDAVTVTYAGMPAIFENLDQIFRPYGPAHIICLGVIVENTVIQAIVIWYLLERNFNFFLLPGQSPSAGGLPVFCDLILSSQGDPLPGDPAAALRLRYNDQRSTSCPGLPPGSGTIIFSSSGTTGPAKYICFQKQRLLQNARNCVERFGITDKSRVLVTVPVGHMYGLGVGLLPALLSGASCRLVEKNNAIKFIDSAGRFRPTVTLITPAFARMLLQLNKKIDVPGIYITAGEKLEPLAYRKFEGLLGPLFNLYGCTEMGAIAVSPEEENSDRGRAEGLVRSLPHVEISVGEGSTGPIACRHNAGFSFYIDGKGSQAPAACSVEGWYNTMDLGEIAPNGCFYVRGRLDHCVNRSGYLVSLDEIAGQLERLLAEVSQAVVLEVNGGEGQLLAICEASGNAIPDISVLKRQLREQMNKVLIPDQFIFVSHLPRLQNGKPDRAAMAKQYTWKNNTIIIQ